MTRGTVARTAIKRNTDLATTLASFAREKLGRVAEISCRVLTAPGLKARATVL